MKGGERKKITSLNVLHKKIYGVPATPIFMEWLMGFPIGWSELSASGMQWFRSRRQKRLKD
jgi:hypothetical protein